MQFVKKTVHIHVRQYIFKLDNLCIFIPANAFPCRGIPIYAKGFAPSTILTVLFIPHVNCWGFLLKKHHLFEKSGNFNHLFFFI